ncbi:uncharacterized protein [Henckelia pumila]|uniref:uncharacterized protein n=1 Tax=Henckelia pumila TaxID=405737 RepID=UPI003C6E8F4A
MIKVRNRAESFIGWKIVKGDVSFWFDSWIPKGNLATIIPIQGLPSHQVNWFIEDGNWNANRLLLVVPPDIANWILKVPIHPLNLDRAVWKQSINGAFSSKSAWEVIRSRDTAIDWFGGCWSRLLRPSISFFCWRWFFHKLPVDDILQSRGVVLASTFHCCRSSESFDHIFFSGILATAVWPYYSNIFGVHDPHIFGNWRVWTQWRKKGRVREMVSYLIIWFLWRAINWYRHKGRIVNASIVIKWFNDHIFAINKAGIF